jgi:hypothetical protein
MFKEVNPAAESTWKNHARPGEFPLFEKELLLIGGRHLNGRQMLRLRWAPEHRKFQLGRARLYAGYADDRIPTRRKLKRFYYQVKDLTDPFAPWITVEPENLGRYPGEVYLHLACHDAEIETIARQQWAIEQYFPPDRLGETPEQWNARRFRFFTPPETNVPVYGDDIGPFPSEGEYRNILLIEGPRPYAYHPPCEEALQVLRQSWSLREHYHQSVSREKQVENDYERAAERERKINAERDAQLEDEFVKPFEGERVSVVVP